MVSLFNFNKDIKKAVAYYRHSAEDKQENSVAIQKEQTEKFAKQHDIEIIHEEADEGKSGLLGSEGRPAFKRLFDNWINNPNASDFDYVLVLDESRWGRFQNLNEAGRYTYECEKNGKEVVYVASGFVTEENRLERHLTSDVKRYMAAKYSFELSNKVFYGCVKVSEQGFSAGGIAPYGMARLLLDVNKKPVKILKKGEHKAISNARVILTPANDKATETVKEIFSLFVSKEESPDNIAEYLNNEKIPSANGRVWNSEKILRILKNEKYTGTMIYNKTWGRLKQRKKDNPRDIWVVVPKAFKSIIDMETFNRAQERLYWLTPSKRKKGTYKIRKAKRLVSDELKNLFLDKKIHIDDAIMAIGQFPVIYGVPFSSKPASPCWCFVAPNEMRKYKFILGIGVALNNRNPIDRIFVIPTNEFGLGEFCIFSEQDEAYSQYYVGADEVKEKVLDIAQELDVYMPLDQLSQSP